MSSSPLIKLAIIDMYESVPNEGMRCLKTFAEALGNHVQWEIFDARGKNEMPDADFDIFISSGGPGSPYAGENSEWEKKFFDLVDKIWAHNQKSNGRKKYFFGICYSFQLVARHFNLGNICLRKSTSFGVFPVHKTENAKHDHYFRSLPDPYYVIDSRDWQMIEPNLEKLSALGAEILAIEKKREHVPLPRAVMAIRLSNEMYITQFHPEADAEGMLRHFANPGKRENIIEQYGDWKLDEMIRSLSDPQKIPLTHRAVLPSFLKSSLLALASNE